MGGKERVVGGVWEERGRAGKGGYLQVWLRLFVCAFRVWNPVYNICDVWVWVSAESGKVACPKVRRLCLFETNRVDCCHLVQTLSFFPFSGVPYFLDILPKIVALINKKHFASTCLRILRNVLAIISRRGKRRGQENCTI